MWSVEASIELARKYVGGMGDRWAHLSTVGRVVQRLRAEAAEAVTEDVVCAAWLHDIGYAPVLAVTGFHSLDGARFLELAAAPSSS